MTMATTPTLLDPDFLAKLEQLEIVSRKIFVGKLKGERLSKKRGTSVEFADYRNYAVGDDLRFIDWNIYGRLDRLFLKLFLEEEDLHVYVLIDTSGSMRFGQPQKLHYAKQVAAALAYIALVNLDRVVIQPFADDLRPPMRPTRGRGQMWRVVEYLHALEPEGTSALARSMRNFVIRHPGKGVAIVISDMMDKAGYEEGLRYLVAGRMDLFVIQVLSKEEVDPELAGDLKLTDCEDGTETDVTISAPLLKRYQQNLNAFRAALHQYLNRRGASYIFTTTAHPFEQLVLSYLRQRGLVR